MTAQNQKTGFTVIPLLFFWVTLSSAAMREALPGSEPAATVPMQRNTFHPRDLVLEGKVGPSILKGQVGIGLGFQAALGKKFALEAGGVLPHPVSGFAEYSKAGNSLTANVAAHVCKFSESHLILLYRFVQTPRYRVEAGAGLSIGVITNETHFTYNNPALPGMVTRTTRLLPSPRLQTGVSASLTSRVSLGLSLSWVRYSNEDNNSGLSIDLGFSGLLIEPMLQVRF